MAHVEPIRNVEVWQVIHAYVALTYFTRMLAAYFTGDADKLVEALAILEWRSRLFRDNPFR